MDTLDDFENNQKVLYFGGVFGLASKTVKLKDLVAMLRAILEGVRLLLGMALTLAME